MNISKETQKEQMKDFNLVLSYAVHHEDFVEARFLEELESHMFNRGFLTDLQWARVKRLIFAYKMEAWFEEEEFGEI